MTHRLATNYAKNYCNRTLTVKVIVENEVTCFFGTQCISDEPCQWEKANFDPPKLRHLLTDRPETQN